MKDMILLILGLALVDLYALKGFLGRTPLLGQDSEEVLRGLGYSEEEMKAMHASGVYQSWDDLKAKHNG